MPTPASLLLRSLPRIKRRAILTTPLRLLSTSTPETAEGPIIRRVSAHATGVPDTDALEDAEKPLIRKIAIDGGSRSPLVEGGSNSPPVRRYEALPDFAFTETGRTVLEKATDGPLIHKTGASWTGFAGPTIRKEFNYFAPAAEAAKEENPNRIVIERKDPDRVARIVIERKVPNRDATRRKMTAPGHSAWTQLPPSKRHMTVDEHRVDRPEIETTWVDTHCHLFTTLKMLKDTTNTTIPETDISGLVKAIFPPQVSAVVDIHCDVPLTNLHEHAVSLPWPPHFKYYFSMGVHPHCALSYNDEMHDKITAAMSHPSCVAWGECGLDYFKNHLSTHPTQRIVFARQLTAAVAAGKPIIVHTRDADNDTLALLREHVPKDHHLHVHCFTAGPELARALMTEWTNAYIGLTGVVSYRDMDHVLGLLRSGEIPIERMLLETDGPYMVPRGAYTWLKYEKPLLLTKKFQVSHAGMIPFTAERALQDINAGRAARNEKEVGLVEFLDITRGNAARMYGIDV